MRRWLEAEGRSGELEAFRATQARQREFARRVSQTRERLAVVYRTSESQRGDARAKARRMAAAAPVLSRHPRRPEQRLPRFDRRLHRAGAGIRAVCWPRAAAWKRSTGGRRRSRRSPRSARPSSGNRDIDGLRERRAHAQAVEPGLQVGEHRALLDRQPHPQLHMAAERDVADGEAVAAEVGSMGEGLVGNRQQLSRICAPPRAPRSCRVAPAACAPGPRTPAAGIRARRCAPSPSSGRSRRAA